MTYSCVLLLVPSPNRFEPRRSRHFHRKAMENVAP
jgi:hypothetical protein